jgi:hypothetical protein
MSNKVYIHKHELLKPSDNINSESLNSYIYDIKTHSLAKRSGQFVGGGDSIS